MARTKQTKTDEKPTFNKKAVKSVIKKSQKLSEALGADLDYIKDLGGGKGSEPFDSVKRLREALDTETKELHNIGDQDDQAGVDYCLNSILRAMEDSLVDFEDGVAPFFIAIKDLGLKSKTLKILGEETVLEYVQGLHDELSASEEE